MKQHFRLVGLKNAELLAGLNSIIRQCNGLTADLLAHLAEVEERQLHLELGFPSLHAYCVQDLKMSEGAAGRRVVAARVCRRFPEVFEQVARGELHLSAVCALAPHLRAENAGELLAACSGKARRQVDELLAARFPRADVREQIRRLPEIQPLSGKRFGVHFTADAELRELIERARDLARHRLPDGNLAELMKLALAQFVRAEEKRRFGAGSKARAAKITPPGGVIPENGRTRKRPRYVATAQRREVLVRDGGRCSFVSAAGRRCEARGWLEVDHIQPWAKHGGSEASNLRVLCRAHNLHYARHCFGRLHIAARIAARRQRGRSPTEAHAIT